MVLFSKDTLKKVVRLPGKERREVLKILKKEVRKRSGRRRPNKFVTGVQQKSLGSDDSSVASVNKDWENWVVMHGDEKVAVEDVRGGTRVKEGGCFGGRGGNRGDRALLADVVLQDNATDYWVWRPDPSGGYSVRGAYDLLTSRGDQGVAATTDLIWHKQVPLKVSVAAWRLLRNRLPTKDNLVRRHIIPQGAHLCVAGCGLIRPNYMTILFSLCIPQEVLLPVVLSCSYYGCVPFGCYGMKEILEFLRQKR
ncbi:hypothetical protein TSUD_298350 [Trifolium subterraneum]|nr:hypothetical protein TSUD_298350 [Trifolium subterraneum]